MLKILFSKIDDLCNTIILSKSARHLSAKPDVTFVHLLAAVHMLACAQKRPTSDKISHPPPPLGPCGPWVYPTLYEAPCGYGLKRDQKDKPLFAMGLHLIDTIYFTRRSAALNQCQNAKLLAQGFSA